MKVSAVITLARPLSRAGSDRWGSFLRVNGEREHWWLGRRLTPAEFNEEFPKALRFAGPDRPLVGRIVVEEPEADGEGDCPLMPVSEHEAKIAEIQSGVDAWVVEQNQKLVEAATRIAELEKQLPGPPLPAVEEPISAAGGAAAGGSDPVSAGAQVPDRPAPDPEPDPKAAKKAVKKAK